MGDEIRPHQIQANGVKRRRWDVVVEPGFPFYGSVALGNGTQWRFGAFFTPGGKLFVGIEEHGAYVFDGFVHFTYAMEKFHILNGDAMNVADWINAQIFEPEQIQQGHYKDDLCLEGQRERV
jgi:hypothetical protein